jgi:hypothetical protein
MSPVHLFSTENSPLDAEQPPRKCQVRITNPSTNSKVEPLNFTMCFLENQCFKKKPFDHRIRE